VRYAFVRGLELTHPLDVPQYPTADHIIEYLKAYVKQFDLDKHFKLGLKVERLERSADDRQWTLRLIDKSSQTVVKNFDKVIVATGPFNTAFVPKVPGLEAFKGEIIHAQAYKE
jgi:cation diffusion facilitator CzcD-associated flavoprotein CzcO